MEAGVALLLLLLLLEGVEVRRLRCHPRGLLRRVGVRVAVRERVGVKLPLPLRDWHAERVAVARGEAEAESAPVAVRLAPHGLHCHKNHHDLVHRLHSRLYNHLRLIVNLHIGLFYRFRHYSRVQES